MMTRFFVLGTLILLSSTWLAASDHIPTLEMVDVVENDWTFQEKQKGRTLDSIDALLSLQVRLQALCSDLGHALPDLTHTRASLEQCDASERQHLYKTMRWQLRTIAFENPLIKDVPVAFLKRNRFACQMLHEYLGYYYAYPGIQGGDVCLLVKPGYSFEMQSLTQGRFLQGAFETLSMSYDAKTLYFAFVEIDRPDDHVKDIPWSQLEKYGFHHETFEHINNRKNKFQIYSMSVEDSTFEKLTDDVYDNFDPVPLPDGGIVFLSTRRGGFIRCSGKWEPLPVYTLHRMESDGGNLRTLSFHETNEWHPAVLNDGRVVYSRWDYVDRSAAHYHGLWTCLPDGSRASVLFGNYTQNVSACYQPKAIPGSTKILCVVGAHHAVTGGSLVLLDPMRTSYHYKTGEDTLESLERLTPEVEFPETPNQWPTTYYHSPWPVSENYFFVSYSKEPLGCFGAKSDHTGRTGLYYFDRFGNLELLYEDAEYSCQYPLPLQRRTTPPSIADTRDPTFGDIGELYLENVYKSLVAFSKGRQIKQLRVFQVLPKGPNWVADSPKLGHAHAEGARMLLGTVSVNENGAASFTVPANKPLYFQAVDEQGKAVQTMRSIVYLQPGERRSCVGCHEPLHSAPQNVPLQRNLETIKEGPDGSKPFNYVRLIQPILDRHCVSCHDGSNALGHGKTDLRSGMMQGHFTVSYQNLRPYLRWYEWGKHSIQQTVTLPGKCGADASPLTMILEDQNHKTLDISEEDRRTIYLWLDGNVPFFGVYEPSEQEKQLSGCVVSEPELQ